MNQEEEEGLSLEEIIVNLDERLQYLEAMLSEIYIDHKALFGCMRNTGQFSIDMYKRHRREIEREFRDDEISADDPDPTETNRR